jgi:hypothetical protein
MVFSQPGEAYDNWSSYGGQSSYYGYDYGSRKWTKEEQEKIKRENELYIRQALEKGVDITRKVMAQCRNRQDCLEEVNKALSGLLSKTSNQAAQKYLRDIMENIRVESDKDIFITQLLVWGRLSAERQNEFRNGVRIKPLEGALQKAGVSRSTGGSGQSQQVSSPKFHPDDVMTNLIQQIDKNHQSCQGRRVCLEGDLSVIQRLESQMDRDDPVKYDLKSLSEEITMEANRDLFDPIPVFEKFRAEFSGQEAVVTRNHSREMEKKWNDIRGSGRATQWRDARVLNVKEMKKQKKDQSKQAFQKMGEEALENVLGGFAKNLGL